MNGSTKGIRNENLRFPYRNQLSSRRSFTPNIRVDLPSTSNSIELSNCNPSTTHLSRFNPSPRTSTPLNATPKAKHETVVNYDFADDPMPPNTCCCGKVKIQMGCRIVATCSLLAIIANAVLYFFGIPRLGLSGTIEIVLLIIDFLTVFFLFLGLSKHRAGLLKPYLFFNSLWTFCLCLLLLVCLWKIIRGGELSNNILSNLQNIRAQPTEEPEDDYHRRIRPTNSVSTGVSYLVTAAVMLGLVTIIVIDSFFIHIVYRTFHFFAYQEDKAKENRNNQTSTTTL